MMFPNQVMVARPHSSHDKGGDLPYPAFLLIRTQAHLVTGTLIGLTACCT